MSVQKAMSSRREFLEQVTVMAPLLAAGAGSLRAEEAKPVPPPARAFERKIKVGVVGLGKRGKWLAGLVKKHGGYEITAVADYFDDLAQAGARELGVPENRVFTGLSGYKRVLDSRVEALILEDVPCFYPEQATAAVEAGCHVYMAKPFAVDVPGVFTMEAAYKKATAKKLCFLVDYQLPRDPDNQEVVRRIRENGLEGVAHIYSGGRMGTQADPAYGPSVEQLLREHGWLAHTNLGGDAIVAYDIHIIDGVTWALGKSPVSACGSSRTLRANPHGDRIDCGGVVYQYDDGVLWTHLTQALPNNADFLDLGADIMGLRATARVSYYGKVYMHGGAKHYVGAASKSIYVDGANANISEFYRCITEGDFSNPTGPRAVAGHLTAILGREAMARKTTVTLDEVIKENRKWPVDLKGLKA